MNPVFLTVEQVIYVHSRLIQLHGGLAGIKDKGLVEHCVYAPQASWGGEFLYKSIPEMAAAYWFSLTMGHAFNDGNKRIGLASAQVFLELNGFELTFSEQEAVQITLRVASSMLSRDGLKELVATHVQALPKT